MYIYLHIQDVWLTCAGVWVHAINVGRLPRITRSLQPMRYTGAQISWPIGGSNRGDLCGFVFWVLGCTWWWVWIWHWCFWGFGLNPTVLAQVLYFKFTVFWSKCQLLLSIDPKVAGLFVLEIPFVSAFDLRDLITSCLQFLVKMITFFELLIVFNKISLSSLKA